MQLIFTKKSIKTITLAIIVIGVVLGVFSSGISVRYAHATLPTADVATTAGVNVGAASQTTSTGKDIAKFIGESVLSPIAQQLMSQVLDKMNSSIIKWVNSGFEGNPFYIDEPEQFFQNIALDVASDSAAVIRNRITDDPNSPANQDKSGYEREILASLGRSGFRSQTDKLSLSSDFKNAFSSNSQSANKTQSELIEDFSQDFSQGGTAAWESITLEENANPFEALENTKEVIIEGIEEQGRLLKEEGTFVSERKCKPGAEREITGSDGQVISTYCLQHEVETPSQLVTSQLEQAISTPFENLINSSDNPYAQLASSALQGLVVGVMEAGFNKLTSVTFGAFTNAGNPSSGEVFEEVTLVGFDEADFASNNGPGFNSISLFDVDAFIYGDFETYIDSSSQRGVIALSDGTLVLETDFENPIGQIEEFTGSTVNISGLTMTYEEPSGYTLGRVISDPTNRFPLEYYYIDEGDGYLFKGDKQDNQNVFSLRRVRTADERLGDLVAILNQQRSELSDLPALAMAVDQDCVLGPDLNFDVRFSQYFGKETQKAQRKDDKEKWDDALEGVTYAKNFFFTEVVEEMTSDIMTVRNTTLRDEILSYNDTFNELGYRIPRLNAVRAQVDVLIEQYLDPTTSPEEKEKALTRLARLEQDGSIPKYEQVELEYDNYDQLVKSEASLRDRYDKCWNEIKEKAGDPQVWPDDWYIQNKVVQDIYEVLYCPYQQLGRYSDGGRTPVPGAPGTAYYEYPGQHTTLALGELKHAEVFAEGNKNYNITKPKYSFIPDWIRFPNHDNPDDDYLVSLNIFHKDADPGENDANDKKNINIYCGEFYRSSIADYMPLQIVSF